MEIENLLPNSFLIENYFASEQNFPGGKYLKINDDKKSKIWEKLFDLPSENFIDFKSLFETIENLFKTSSTKHI